MRMTITNVRLAFPAIFAPQAFGEGEPAYSAKFIVDPKDPQVQKIRDAIAAVAKEKWGEKASSILALLTEQKKVAWVEGPYRNSNGDAYDGFEGKFTLSTRSASTRPSALNRDKTPVTQNDGVIYPGCYVDAAVEFYAQDNKWGRRINCGIRGVRFVGPGDSFGGGSAAASDDFADLADEDFV